MGMTMNRGGKSDTPPPPALVRNPAHKPAPIPVDSYRNVLFPNAVCECRLASGFSSLLALSARLPQIPYIRLSKIERGEVFARADELCMLARLLNVGEPAGLLADVDSPGFAIEAWAPAHGGSRPVNRTFEELAMLLGAALRRLRASHPGLTLARMLEDYRLPAVIVSRIENAVKPIDRWSPETIAALCALFEVTDREALIMLLWGEYEAGALDEWLARIPGAPEREARTRERIGALRTELARLKNWNVDEVLARPSARNAAAQGAAAGIAVASLQVVGVPLGEGLIEPFPNPQYVAPPLGSGPNCYALRMCRASLGPAIPGNAVLIVDPDQTPIDTGLCVLREQGALRVLALSVDREGRLVGHSSNPARDIILDDLPPADLARVTAVLFP